MSFLYVLQGYNVRMDYASPYEPVFQQCTDRQNPAADGKKLLCRLLAGIFGRRIAGKIAFCTNGSDHCSGPSGPMIRYPPAKVA